MEWKIGCSGFYYPEWRGVFYPQDIAQRKWFEYYCQHFNTLELNVTYYKFPRVDMLRRWYDRSPAGFTFSVKAPRHITHLKKFKDAQQMLLDFKAAIREGLSEKLGCVLFQFPSNYHYEAERLARIVDMLDGSPGNVLEFRHTSWWNPTVYETLTQAGITFCGMSHPNLPDDVVGTSDILYYRFHGVPHLYSSAYEVQTLEHTIQQMITPRRGRQAFAYFNNTAEGHAAINARQLQDICELVH